MMTGAPVTEIRRSHFSEDEQSPTDSSEDSVEVKVHPIYAPKQRQLSPTSIKGVKRIPVPTKRKLPEQRISDLYSPKYENEVGISKFFPTSPASRSAFFEGTAVDVKPNEPEVKSQSATFAVVPKKRRLCEIRSQSPISSDITQNSKQTPNEIVTTDMHPPLSVTSPLYWLPPLDHQFPTQPPQTHSTKDFYLPPKEHKHLKIPLFPPSDSPVQQDEPLSLVTKRDKPNPEPCSSGLTLRAPSSEPVSVKNSSFCMESLLQTNGSQRSEGASPVSNRQKQRNYKNMTRERRIEANARERTRVHTISAAFDALRDAIPSYSHNQKLSKLSILKIASSYILTLGRISGCDLSNDGSEPSIPSCVETLTQTIQAESKVRKRKDE